MHINQLAGNLLLATPTLKDPNFIDSVVLVCSHDEEGSMGLIINRPRDITLADVLSDLHILATGHPDRSPQLAEQLQRPVFEGGPVDEFRGFILHDAWHIYDSTMQVSDELHLTASRDVLEHLANGDGPEHFMMMLGYAGWGPGQLEAELADNDWLIAPASHRIIFQEPPENRWLYGARCMGVDPAQLSNQIGHA